MTAGLVLAAGEGRRFGGPKAPYVHDGVRLVDRAVAVLRDAGCSPVLVVLGAWVGEVPGAVVVENDEWPSGMGSSLRAGLEALSAYDEVDRAVVTLVDLPGLTAAAVRRVTDVAVPEPRRQLAAATYDGRRGHPVLLGRAHWDEIASTASGDHGAREYLSSHDVTGVEVSDLASGEDLDVRP